MTDHPLTETAAAVLWNAHRSPNALPFHAQGRLYVQSQTAMLRAAFDAGREHERTTPAEEVELPGEFGAVLTDVRYGDDGKIDRLVYAGRAGWVDEAGHFWYPIDFAAFTLPDDTRARRCGGRPDGTPRFVKEDSP